MSVCLSVCLDVRALSTFERKTLETCGFLQMLRTRSDCVFKKKLCPSGHFSGRKLAGTGPDWSQNAQKRTKMVTNGQKWAFLTCNLLQMVGPDGGHIFEKKIGPALFLGAGAGPFFREKTAKND